MLMFMDNVQIQKVTNGPLRFCSTFSNQEPEILKRIENPFDGLQIPSLGLMLCKNIKVRSSVCDVCH